MFKLDKTEIFNNEIKKDDLYKISPSPSSLGNLNKNADILFESQQTSNHVDICNSFLSYKITISEIEGW